MPYREIPWTPRNRRVVPSAVKKKVEAFGDTPFQAGTTLPITRDQAEGGVFRHLQIEWGEGGLTLPHRVLPLAEMGKWSARNTIGHEIVHDDQAKELRYRTVETPNFGDWSKGSHPVDLPYEAYPRTYFPPKYASLELDVIAENRVEGTTEVRCRCDEVLQTGMRHFDTHLLWDLNLLQENVGSADVFPADATREDYLETLRVNWEILPPGERESNIATIIGRGRQVDPEVRRELEERYEFLERLSPRNFVAGTSGFARYFGAQFRDDLVVFENVEYGNAAYVMGEDWEELSRLTRTELLKRAELDFDRLIHRGAWKPKLKAVIRRRLRDG